MCRGSSSSKFYFQLNSGDIVSELIIDKFTVSMSIIISRALGYDPDPVEEMMWGLTHDALHVAHKSVHVPLAPRLLDDVLVVIISQTTRQLLIIHFWLVLSKSPPSCDLNEYMYITGK